MENSSDLYRLRGQALTIALVVGVGFGSYITLRTAWRALGQSRAVYYDHYRFADVFASLKRAPESVAERVADVPGVSKMHYLKMVCVLGVAFVVGVIVVAWIPNPVDVEIADVSRGPMVVTVDEDGRTRVIDRYLISAPIAGNLGRINLDAGDAIEADQVLARLVPLPPPRPWSNRAAWRSEGDDALRVPASAVFRHDESWATFVVEDARSFARWSLARATVWKPRSFLG